MLSQIEPQTPILVVPPLSFSLATILPPEPKNFGFPKAPDGATTKIVCAAHRALVGIVYGIGLRRCLIVFDPLTFVLDQWKRPWQMLSQSAVFHKSKNFTSDCEIPMPPTVPINHYFRPAACAQQSCTHTGQQKTGPKVLFCCSMLIYSSKKCACFEHSNFFKVKPQIPRPQEGGKCMLRRQMNAS